MADENFAAYDRGN